MMVLAVGSFVFNCIQQYGADVTRYISADKLFLGRNGSNDLAVLLPFLLPLLFVLPFADSYITDRQHYILPAILSRASARQYYFSKLSCVALSAGAVIFVPLLLNFLLGLVAFPLTSTNYAFISSPGSEGAYYTYHMKEILFPGLFVDHPYFYDLVFLLMLTAFCVICAVVTYQCSFLIAKNRIVLLCLPFLLNNFLILFAQYTPINISPFDYLIAFNDAPHKRPFMLLVFFGVMLLAYTAGVVLSVWQETGGSRQIDGMGISQELGSMEGKEIRIGSAASAMWGMTTTVTSNGSVNSMHDSQTPLSGMLQMLNMQINCWFGGVGVGWMNYFAFLIIAVFISGLMVGRTPEFLGRKVEAREMKIATLVVLLHPFLILVGTGISAAVAAANPEIGWLNNPSFHGLSEMLYEYTSSAANNGSGFEGLADNTPFWNISTGIALIMGRYFPIVGQVAIAGLLASKKCIPESAGTLRTDTGTFSLMTFAVIIIVAALSFFPALALGPIADYLTF